MTQNPPPRDHSGLRLRYAAVSDLGRHRKDNQDSGYAGDHLLVVADGVGGAAYGDVASSTAVHVLRRLDDGPTEEMLPALAGAVHRVHDRLAELVEADAELDGTSTTLTAALFDGSRLGIGHVGDSRAYLWHDGELRQLTKDHTFVQTLVDEGRITEEASRTHPHRNIILRAVDGVHDTEPDLFEVDLAPGDRVMLCSDGASGVLDLGAIARLLTEGSVDSAAVDLVQAALDAGTTDNVTVVVAEVVAADTADDPEGAMALTGPMLVGAAANQPRKAGLGRGLFRHRQTDTGELEPVPGDDPVDEEELRYAPRPPRRHPVLRRIALLLLPLLVLGGIAAWGYDWSQKQYYVAADGPYVAVYRGVQLDLPGIALTSLDETSRVRIEDLSEFNQQKVDDGIVADSRTDALRILENLAETVPAQDDCDEVEPEPKRDRKKNPGATDDPTPTSGPTGQPTEDPVEADSAADCAEGEGGSAS